MSVQFFHFFEVPLKHKQGQCHPGRSFPSSKSKADEIPRIRGRQQANGGPHRLTPPAPDPPFRLDDVVDSSFNGPFLRRIICRKLDLRAVRPSCLLRRLLHEFARVGNHLGFDTSYRESTCIHDLQYFQSDSREFIWIIFLSCLTVSLSLELQVRRHSTACISTL